MPDFEARQADWISFRDAIRQVLAAASSLPPRTVPLLESSGLALAATVHASLTLPPGPTSHMDGYALRAEEVAEPRLRVVGRSLPGHPWGDRLPAGSAIRIMTGALLPEGADTIVPVEHTDREAAESGWVRLVRPDGSMTAVPEAGQHVRPPGEEMKTGDELGRPGDSVGFGLLALLAAAGEREVSVHPAPRVAIVVTGDELVPAGHRAELGGGVRRADILSPSLPLLFLQAGATPLPPVRAGDDPAALREALERAAASADLVVTTGGASMGEADLVKKTLDSLGGEPVFWRIRMRPGSPVSLTRLPRPDGGGSVPVLGLPGNPVSSWVTCLTLALPAARAMGGHRARLLRRIRAVARDRFAGPEHLTRFFRVTLAPEAEGALGAASAGPQGSGALQSMARADGLAVLSEGMPSVEPGDSVDVLLIPGAPWAESP